jgi:TonB family protein
MNRVFRSLMQTFLVAACALTLNLTSLDLTAQAQGSSGDGHAAIRSSHSANQKKRRRARRRARTARRRETPREFVDTTMVSPPVVGAVKGTPDYIPPGNDVVYGDPNAPVPNAPSSPPRTTLKEPIRGGILNGKAISLPKPAYPAIARSARASGTVVVQVIVDETGKVISARAISGHPLLQAAAVQAAYGARFSPTQLSGQPVKVTGTISYNFVQ